MIHSYKQGKLAQRTPKMFACFSQAQGRGLNQPCTSDLHLSLIVIHIPSNQVLAEGLHNEEKESCPHLLVLDVLLLKPMQDLLLQPETKEKKLTLKNP